jgi:XXXCH domain-containing protein
MNDGGDKAKKKVMSAAEAAELLRELADKLEQGKLTVGNLEASPDRDVTVKVSGKAKDGSASLALKFKWDSADAVPATEAGKPAARKPSYKSIKKRMSSTFKKIRADLQAGRIPDADLTALFDEDAELMLLHPKKGEWEEIKAFRELSAEFATAVKTGDADAVARQVDALRAAEKSCHKKYK